MRDVKAYTTLTYHGIRAQLWNRGEERIFKVRWQIGRFNSGEGVFYF